MEKDTMIHLVIPDPHSHFEHNNDRAIWAGKLINDIKPDVVVVLGDTADMPSLASYDKGTRAFNGRTYRADIAAHGDFQEKLWGTVRRAKRRMPRRVTLIGNHEHRIERAINLQPELDGTVALKDLDLERYYNDVVYYNGSTPGTISIDGVRYGHFVPSGVQGRPVGGQHPGYSLVQQGLSSCTVGHTHVLDFYTRRSADGRWACGLVAGCYQDYTPDYAGEAGSFWWRGIVVKRNVESGSYSPQFISIDELRQEYGSTGRLSN